MAQKHKICLITKHTDSKELLYVSKGAKIAINMIKSERCLC